MLRLKSQLQLPAKVNLYHYHSGCGKSTILNALAGYTPVAPSSLNGKEVTGPSLERGVVFQNCSLMPWLSAPKNVIFWRSRAGQREQRRENTVAATCPQGSDEALHRVAQPSGGMRQREVSIARAFATQPSHR
jgi:nitrate/nitrite transport system ATP-binding protein